MAKSAIGRDINPSELIRCMMEAGAKRVEIKHPVFKSVQHTELAQCSNQSIGYGGLEYD